MTALWRWISVRRWWEERWRVVLTVSGVALGVAVFVSIRLASHSALASFSDTVDAVTGRADLQLRGDSDGFDERVFAEVTRIPGVLGAAPVIETYALARAGPPPDVAPGAPPPRYDETLLVLGVDVFRERRFARLADADRRQVVDIAGFLGDPHAVLITRALADRHGLEIGDSLTLLSAGRPVPLTVRGMLASTELDQAFAGNVVVVDLSTAQDVFGRWGRLDRIDLKVGPGRAAAVAAELARVAPPGVEVGPPEGRTKQVESLVSAFELNLTALAFIALFVAGVLIFNAIAMSVVRRRRELGTLRAIGLERAQVARLILLEGATLGALGSVIGLLLGTWVADLALGAVSRTLTELYLIAGAERLRLDPWTYGIGLAIGCATAIVAAWLPALEASRTSPTAAMRQGAFIESRGMPVGRWALAGGAFLVAALLVALWTVSERRPWGGFVSAFLVLAGSALLAPIVVRAGAALSARLCHGVSTEGWLGSRYIGDAVARTSVVVAALLTAIGMLVGLDTMVASFRRTVDTWITQTLRGDLYVEPADHWVSGALAGLPDSFVAGLAEIPGVAAVDTYRSLRTTYGGRAAFVVGIDFDVQVRHGRLAFLTGSSDEILARALARDEVVVTESFAHHHLVRVGDTLSLPTPIGEKRPVVAGIFGDYSTDAGAVLMDRRLFSRWWRDHRTESLALYLAPGGEPETVRRRAAELAGPGLVLRIMPNQALRERVLTVFDQTFQITYALQAIAVLVAFLGVASTLTGLTVQRAGEIGVLRAIGALRGQVQAMVLVESGLIGLVGGLLGCACGAALAVVLAHLINRQYFGWSIHLAWFPGIFLRSLALSVVAAVLAGWVPARLASARPPLDAIRTDA
jgi:putative ABC transport system permease protein